MSSTGSSRGIASALVAALLCAPIAPGLAQPAPQPNSAQVTQAKDLVNKAIAKSQAGDHTSAIDLYLQAYTIAPLPLLLSNLGSEYQQANKPVDALKYFCKYLEAEPTGPNASYATAQAKILQTQLHNPVDDNNVCKPVPATQPPPPGPGAGSAAPTAGSASQPDETPGPGLGSAAAPAPAPSHALAYAGIGMAGAGAILVALGVVYGVKAGNISSEITNHPATQPWPDNINDLEAEGQSDQTKQIGFLIAGGVLVIAGAAVYYVGHKHAAEERSYVVAPSVAPGYGGLAFSARW